MTQKKEELKLDDSVKVNSKGEAILGKLTGPVADVVNPTRNGRKYSDSLWRKVFQDPIVKEYFEAGGLLGELNHPEDRLETDLTQVAVCMPEPPKEGKDGKLYATLDILDTPNGRILYTLAKYGYKLGISSRGNGETYEDIDGTETVDEDTYKLEAWDVVLLPAVKAARLSLVNESYNVNSKSLKEALNESISNAVTEEEKRIMEATISRLHLFDEVEKKDLAVNDVKAKIVKQLQESLKENTKLENQIIELQEKLSVCYAKEAKYEESLDNYKLKIKELNESIKKDNDLNKTIKSLNEQITNRDKIIKDNEIKLKENDRSKQIQKSLKESLLETQTQLEKSSSQNTLLKEEINNLKESNIKEQKILKENIENLKQDLNIKSKEYLNKLSQANSLTEKYKKIANSAVNKYIDSQALRLGVNSDIIKNKLPENYSFNDIDKLCEDLSGYNLRINDLPFDVNDKLQIKINKTKNLLNNNNIDTSNDIDDLTLQLFKGITD